MKQEVQEVLVNMNGYLARSNNVNARLLSALINDTAVNITRAEIDEIQPMLLCALPETTGTKEAVATLRAELRHTKSTDWQMMYLRYKMGMLAADELTEAFVQIKHDFCTLDVLQEEMSIERAYMILLFVEQMINEQVGEPYVKTIQMTLPALLLRSGKQYNLLEFSILVEALAAGRAYVEEQFVQETARFIAGLQTSKGNFGFQDPFLHHELSEDETLLVTLHVGLAYHKLMQAQI